MEKYSGLLPLVCVLGFSFVLGLILLTTRNAQCNTRYGKYESVEKSCPTLYGLGLRGSMSIQEGTMLLEKEAQRRGWGFGWQQFAFVDHKEKKTFEIWWNPEKGETDLFVNGVLQGRSHAPKA